MTMKMVLEVEWQELLIIFVISTWLIIMKHKKFIHCLNFHNQQWWALSESLPCSGFKHVEDVSVFTPDFIINVCKKSDFGYKLLVDVDYLEDLQLLHKVFKSLKFKQRN